MIPNVTINITDGALGTVPAGAGDVMAIVGPSSAGPINVPAMYAQPKDIRATYGDGIAVEAAAYALDAEGPRKPLVFVRAESTPGTYGTLDDSGMVGTSVPSPTTSTHPLDDYEVVVEFAAGGTIGVDGITYTWSLDGGRTMSPITALGAATSIAIAGSGVSVDLDVGTILAGDSFTLACVSPAVSPTQLLVALDALGATALGWEFVELAVPVTAANVSTVIAWLAAMEANGKPTLAIGGAVLPTEAQTEAQYLAAQQTALGAVADTGLAVCFAAAKIDSYVSRRKYRRSPCIAVAGRLSKIPFEVDAAEVDLGALKGVTIRDANGNTDEHDEVANPGADDARFIALRSIDGYGGAYVNNPNLMSAAGSDYRYIQHKRVINRACRALRRFFVSKLSKGLKLDKKTGYVTESEALGLEAGAMAILRDIIGGQVSAYSFVLSRTDNVLSTGRITGTARLTPLAYPKEFVLDLGYENPALRAA